MSIEHSPAKQQRVSGSIDPYAVLPLKEWLKLAGVSRSTGLRILESPDGPKKLKLSAKRIGIRMIDHVRWTERMAKRAG
jgi:predicted DNA-binding transcriptional regulator AlpA